MKKYIIVAIVAILAWKWIETNPFAQLIPNGQVPVNYSLAELQYAQAAKVQQEIRRQNEQDNGLGVNMGARIVTGKGITDFEQLSSVGFVVTLVIVIAISALLGALLLIVLIKLTASHTTHV